MKIFVKFQKIIFGDLIVKNYRSRTFAYVMFCVKKAYLYYFSHENRMQSFYRSTDIIDLYENYLCEVESKIL